MVFVLLEFVADFLGEADEFGGFFETAAMFGFEDLFGLKLAVREADGGRVVRLRALILSQEKQSKQQGWHAFTVARHCYHDE